MVKELKKYIDLKQSYWLSNKEMILMLINQQILMTDINIFIRQIIPFTGKF